jgi:hypothetical protein
VAQRGGHCRGTLRGAVCEEKRARRTSPVAWRAQRRCKAAQLVWARVATLSEDGLQLVLYGRPLVGERSCAEPAYSGDKPHIIDASKAKTPVVDVFPEDEVTPVRHARTDPEFPPPGTQR